LRRQKTSEGPEDLFQIKPGSHQANSKVQCPVSTGRRMKYKRVVAPGGETRVREGEPQRC
jgi:hypothetical protein